MNKFSTLITLALAASSASALTGCGKEATPPAETPAASEEAPAEAAPAEKDEAETSDINISDRIREACGITDTDAHFEFDSAHVSSEDSTTFKKLVECFTTGPLKGETMKLVGHADSRGDADYNLVLAGRRAENVGAALKNEGMPKNQVSATSRGEMDASGTDEESMALDRRVDIMLASE